MLQQINDINEFYYIVVPVPISCFLNAGITTPQECNQPLNPFQRTIDYWVPETYQMQPPQQQQQEPQTLPNFIPPEESVRQSQPETPGEHNAMCECPGHRRRPGRPKDAEKTRIFFFCNCPECPIRRDAHARLINGRLRYVVSYKQKKNLRRHPCIKRRFPDKNIKLADLIKYSKDEGLIVEFRDETIPLENAI